jgi:NAD(P)-dependent dehydrogenase (short-subunit alcohol dehydrogenase family)
MPRAGKGGADIIATSRSQDELEAVREVESMGSNSLAIQADISKESDVISLVSESARQFERIDILANNARVAVRKPLIEILKAFVQRGCKTAGLAYQSKT